MKKGFLATYLVLLGAVQVVMFLILANVAYQVVQIEEFLNTITHKTQADQ